MFFTLFTEAFLVVVGEQYIGNTSSTQSGIALDIGCTFIPLMVMQ